MLTPSYPTGFPSQPYLRPGQPVPPPTLTPRRGQWPPRRDINYPLTFGPPQPPTTAPMTPASTVPSYNFPVPTPAGYDPRYGGVPGPLPVVSRAGMFALEQPQAAQTIKSAYDFVNSLLTGDWAREAALKAAAVFGARTGMPGSGAARAFGQKWYANELMRQALEGTRALMELNRNVYETQVTPPEYVSEIMARNAMMAAAPIPAVAGEYMLQQFYNPGGRQQQTLPFGWAGAFATTRAAQPPVPQPPQSGEEQVQQNQRRVAETEERQRNAWLQWLDTPAGKEWYWRYIARPTDAGNMYWQYVYAGKSLPRPPGAFRGQKRVA